MTQIFESGSIMSSINRLHKFNKLCRLNSSAEIADNIDADSQEEIIEAWLEAYPDELTEACLGHEVESQFTTTLMGAVFAKRAEDILELQRFVRHCVWQSIKGMVQNQMDEENDLDDYPIDNDNMMRGAT